MAGNPSANVPNRPSNRTAALRPAMEERCTLFACNTAWSARASHGPRGFWYRLPALVIEVGGRSEEIVVKGEAPLVQAASGEKSFTITTEAVASLPLANRSYTALLGLMPGVQTSDGLTPATRLGGGGDGNFMLD